MAETINITLPYFVVNFIKNVSTKHQISLNNENIWLIGYNVDWISLSTNTGSFCRAGGEKIDGEIQELGNRLE